jgi:DNA repair protein RadC
MINLNEVQDVLAHISEVQPRYTRKQSGHGIKISSSTDAEKVARAFYQHKDLQIDYKEYFVAVFLSRANRVLSINIISEGSDCGTVVGIKEMFQIAIMTNAKGIILCHNHPSGNNKPSQADLDITKKIKQGGGYFDILLLDHLIISSEAYMSLANKGNM